MKVELTPDAAQWVEAEIAAGTFPTPEDAVRHAVDQLRLNGLRATLDAAVAEGGCHTTEDARRFVCEQLEQRNQTAPEALEIVRRAAEIEGRSVSDFVVDAAQEAARKTIEDTHIIRLAAQDQLRFVKLALDPPPLTPAMERARAAHARLTQD